MDSEEELLLKHKKDEDERKLLKARVDWVVDREDLPEVRLYNKWKEVRKWSQLSKADKWLDTYELIIFVKEEYAEWLKNEYISWRICGDRQQGICEDEAWQRRHSEHPIIRLRAPSFYAIATKELIYDWINVFCSLEENVIRRVAIHCLSTDSLYFYDDEKLVKLAEEEVK